MTSNVGDTEITARLEDHERRITRLEGLLQGKKGRPAKQETLDTANRMRPLAEAARLQEDQVKNVFDFSGEDIRLIAPIEGKDEREKQLKATLCILTAHHYCYDKDEMRSRDLREKLQWLGIKSLSNLSGNLGTFKQFLLPRGKAGSPEFQYKITFPGLKRGLQVIAELATA